MPIPALHQLPVTDPGDDLLNHELKTGRGVSIGELPVLLLNPASEARQHGCGSHNHPPAHPPYMTGNVVGSGPPGKLAVQRQKAGQEKPAVAEDLRRRNRKGAPGTPGLKTAESLYPNRFNRPSQGRMKTLTIVETMLAEVA